MSEKSEIVCVTPSCVEYQAKYNYPGRVYDRDGYSQCENCGGKLIAGTWIHKCKQCGVDVAPGKLTGLFVPHSCGACMQKVYEREKASGHVCRMCNSVFSKCCC